MLYLRPVGGLCNRLRTIDSFINICKNNRLDLTILWTMDSSLNCYFEELYNPLRFGEFNIKIINVPGGFPDLNLVKIGKLGPDSYKIDLTKKDGLVKSKIKATLSNLKTTRIQNEVLEKIKILPPERIISNLELGNIYESDRKINESISEMDSKFITKVLPFINNTIGGDMDSYIDCCYRVYEMESNYGYLIPIESLRDRIFSITKKFDQDTLGLHIRKTDHVIAQAVSTDKKFFEIIDKSIKENKLVKFFLSTDDEKTKTSLEKEFGKRIISAPITSFDRNDKEGIKDALVDLYCLSYTRKIFGSHQSSFSQTASEIGKIENSIVI